jgi:hypothetical protein
MPHDLVVAERTFGEHQQIDIVSPDEVAQTACNRARRCKTRCAG